MIGAVSYTYGEKLHIEIYETGTYGDIDWKNPQSIPQRPDLVADALKDPAGQSHVRVEQGLGDDYVLRLTETRRYTLRFQPGQEPHVRNEGNKFLKVERDENSLTFQFINYLGHGAILLGGDNRLDFEVVPDKISYEDDYIELTEAIARECSQLLMDYTGVTTSDFSQSQDTGRTLLEQFIFLRQFCFAGNLRSLFAGIKRHPDKVLLKRQDFRPLSYGVPSKKFYKKPFTYGKGWRRMEDGTALPTTVAVVHKYDSLDTPANRFVKFALEKFHTICDELIATLAEDAEGQQAACLEEARIIRAMLEEIFHDGFFDEVGPLDHMPQNNPVLLKREGYAAVLAAYAMTDFALQLDWRGQDTVYEGEARNVALLYEYWLFFELRKGLAQLPGAVAMDGGDKPFLNWDEDHHLSVTLQQGTESCQSYALPEQHTKINLYYNRTFSPAEFRATRYEGSYSRSFRPDYTIAVYPDVFAGGKDNGESQAIRAGLVSYIHFDAKYRITDLTAFMRKGDEAQEAEELAEDKAAEVMNTYKRGDLLKMHTYNDAIRRTVGSYVLYPGDGHKQGSLQTFSMYDEIIPGVGAFAIKPSNNEAGEQELAEFLTNLIRVKMEQDSRLNRVKYYNEMIIREPGAGRASVVEEQAAGMDQFVMGFIRKGYHDFLQGHGKLESGGEFLFYFYAIKGSFVYAHHKDVFQTKGFRFYVNNPRRDREYVLEPVACTIESNALVSRHDLTAMLADTGYVTTEKAHSADFYYVLRVRVTGETSERKLSRDEVERQNGNDAVSPHSPKVISG